MITLWLVRHGVTDWNEQKRYQGHSDIALNETGKRQAQQIAQRLSSEKLHIILSSDLQRAMETAQIIATLHQLTVQPDSRLRETNFGLFEGLTYKNVIDQHKAAAETWFADPERPPHGGETLSGVTSRVKTAIGTIIEQYPRKNILIVGHDGSLRIALCELLELKSTQYWRFNLDPCSLTRVNVYPGGAILIRLNDVCHLEAVL